MAGIDLLSIQPHQVSRDLSGYSVFLFGDPKSGKTTIATKFPKHLLLATERGYNAIPGAMAQPINSWADFKRTLRELKKPEVKEKFANIIIDTADILYDYCEKYICANAKDPVGGIGVDSIGDIPYGQGYVLVEKEFDESLRTIVQLDYGLIIISHAMDKTFKDAEGHEFNQIIPTLNARGRKVVSRMVDIIGYARTVTDENGQLTTKLFMRGTPRFMAGSRFKYTPDYIDFSYPALVKAIGDAIDAEAAENDSNLFTDAHSNLYLNSEPQPSFDDLMQKFNTLINELINHSSQETFQKYYQPKIVEITDKYLGKGQKVSQCSRDQVEALSLIIDDLEHLGKWA